MTLLLASTMIVLAREPIHKMSQHLVAPSIFIATLLLLSSGCSSQTLIEKQCELRLNFGTLSEFEQFIKDFTVLLQEPIVTNKSLKKCLKDSEAIMDLASLVSRQDVCDMQRIDELVAYHRKYFVGGNLLKNRNPITRRFFTRYAIQVAFICKKNLFNNLELAKSELKDRSRVFEEAKERVYMDEPSIRSNIKLIEEQPDEPATSNVKPQSEAELTLSEYREALTQLRLPEDILTFDTEECKNHKSRKTLISRDKSQTFFKPALMCHQLHRYYAGSLLSIARLANIGYTAPFEDLDARIANSPIIRDWIIAVQVCEPMMHMRITETRGEMAVVDTCSEKVNAIERMVFDDSFEDLNNTLLDELIPKSESTRHHAQKIMKSALKKMAKIDLMKQLKSGANKSTIFKRSLMASIHRGLDSSTGGRSKHVSASMSAELLNKFSVEIPGESHDQLLTGQMLRPSSPQLSDKETHDVLLQIVANSDKQMQAMCPVSEDNEIDKPVAFDLLSSVASTVLILAIMMVFEWVFFIVMTIAARICNELYFNFENLLTFPPKILSWSDADFARYTDELDNVDEDDFFDYEELNPGEQRQRDLLAKVFGKPPPMFFKD